MPNRIGSNVPNVQTPATTPSEEPKSAEQKNSPANAQEAPVADRQALKQSSADRAKDTQARGKAQQEQLQGQLEQISAAEKLSKELEIKLAQAGKCVGDAAQVVNDQMKKIEILEGQLKIMPDEFKPAIQNQLDKENASLKEARIKLQQETENKQLIQQQVDHLRQFEENIIKDIMKKSPASDLRG